MRQKARAQYSVQLLSKPSDRCREASSADLADANTALRSRIAESLTIVERDITVPSYMPPLPPNNLLEQAPATSKSSSPIRTSSVSRAIVTTTVDESSATQLAFCDDEELLDLSKERRRIQAERDARRKARLQTETQAPRNVMRRMIPSQPLSKETVRHFPEDPAAVVPFASQAFASSARAKGSVPLNNESDSDVDVEPANLFVQDESSSIKLPAKDHAAHLIPTPQHQQEDMNNSIRTVSTLLAQASDTQPTSTKQDSITAPPSSAKVVYRAIVDSDDEDDDGVALAMYRRRIQATGVRVQSASAEQHHVAAQRPPTQRAGILKRSSGGSQRPRSPRRVQWRADVVGYGAASTTSPVNAVLRSRSPTFRAVSNGDDTALTVRSSPRDITAIHSSEYKESEAIAVTKNPTSPAGDGEGEEDEDEEEDMWSGTDDEGDDAGGLWYNDAVDVSSAVDNRRVDIEGSLHQSPVGSASASLSSSVDIEGQAYSPAQVLGIGRIEAVVPSEEGDAASTASSGTLHNMVRNTDSLASDGLGSGQSMVDGTLLQPAGAVPPAVSATLTHLHRDFGMNAFGRLWTALASWRTEATAQFLDGWGESVDETSNVSGVSLTAQAPSQNAAQALAAVSSSRSDAATALATSRRELLLWNLQRGREWLASHGPSGACLSNSSRLVGHVEPEADIRLFAAGSAAALDRLVQTFSVREPVPLFSPALWRAVTLVALACLADAQPLRYKADTETPARALGNAQTSKTLAAPSPSAPEGLLLHDLLASRASALVITPPAPAVAASHPTTAELEAAASRPVQPSELEEAPDDILASEDLALLEVLLLKGQSGVGDFRVRNPTGTSGAPTLSHSELLRQAQRDLLEASKRMAGQEGVPSILSKR